MSEAQHAVVGRRRLVVAYPDGNTREFEIQIEAPVWTSDEEYHCGVRADDILFAGRQRVYGVDAIDALDYAVQFIDTAVANFRSGDIRWLDGTSYKRVPSSDKFGWG
jgi:hypothetical protein